jgi:hypothetical protein
MADRQAMMVLTVLALPLLSPATSRRVIAGVAQGHAATQRLHCVVASPWPKIASLTRPILQGPALRGVRRMKLRTHRVHLCFRSFPAHLNPFQGRAATPISLLGVYATPAD